MTKELGIPMWNSSEWQFTTCPNMLEEYILLVLGEPIVLLQSITAIVLEIKDRHQICRDGFPKF